ncbi:hypothetical protein MASR2M29_13280 [Spirochaetota bacterium]
MRILVFGGSFNPVHIGHLFMAQEVAHEFSYEKVVFIPAFSPPHKALTEDPGAKLRLKMLKMAIGKDIMYKLDRCEIDRKGQSYTIDTIRHIIDSYDIDGKPGLLIGADLVEGFTKWKEPEAISRLCDIIVARRNNQPCALAYPHKIAGNRQINISSTDIKERIVTGRPWTPLVPKPVADFIKQKGLYGAFPCLGENK